MHSAVLVSLIAASSAFAVPLSRRQDDSQDPSTIVIELGGPGFTNIFNVAGDSRQESPRNLPDVINSINVKVGSAVQAQDTRCMAFDAAGKPLIGTRGTNRDITFSDAGKGLWAFEEPRPVVSVVCDPAFGKLDANDPSMGLSVLLQSDGDADSTVTVLRPAVHSEAVTDPNGPLVKAVLLTVGEFVNNVDERCAIFDVNGNAITVTRGTNVEQSFSDAGKGAWTITPPTQVSKIVCDPSLVKSG